MTTKQIDYDDPQRNMYGVLPCPKCGSKYRWPCSPTDPKYPNAIVCDDCKSVEPLEEKKP